MAFKVGADIDAFCTRCKLDTIHVVVAMKPAGDTPKRVECKSCHSLHMYHAPKLPSRTEPAPAPAAFNRSAAARNPPPPKPPKPPKAAPEAKSSPTSATGAREWSRKMEELAMRADLIVRPYSMRETFTAGDPVSHPKFGKGIVVEVLEAKKCAILFEDGRKVLAMGS